MRNSVPGHGVCFCSPAARFPASAEGRWGREWLDPTTPHCSPVLPGTACSGAAGGLGARGLRRLRRSACCRGSPGSPIPGAPEMPEMALEGCAPALRSLAVPLAPAVAQKGASPAPSGSAATGPEVAGRGCCALHRQWQWLWQQHRHSGCFREQGQTVCAAKGRVAPPKLRCRDQEAAPCAPHSPRIGTPRGNHATAQCHSQPILEHRSSRVL